MPDYRHLTPAIARQLLRYDPETGRLFWRKRSVHFFKDGKYSAQRECRRWNARYAGSEAFTATDGPGYRHGSIFGQLHKAHRVAYAIHHGYWPKGEIDHINHDRSDNRISNLRDVSRHINQQNASRSRANTSGHSGVAFSKQQKCWHAYIRAGGRRKHLGSFKKKPDAIAARKAAERTHGFHANHGQPGE